MKKFLLLLFCLVLLITPSFAQQEEINKADNTVHTSDELENVIETLESITNTNNNNNTMIANKLKIIVNELETLAPYKGPSDNMNNDNKVIYPLNLQNTDFIFISDIRGGFYEDSNDVPSSMSYSYLRSSDGAVFSGTIYQYYLRYGYIGPMPYTMYFQAFYEGLLYFDYYAY